MKRAGFTMIELIFVIVILGILAAVAIPKLAATRTDAQVAKLSTNAATLVSDYGAGYTARGDFNATTVWSDITNVDLETAAGTKIATTTAIATDTLISDGTVVCLNFATSSSSGGPLDTLTVTAGAASAVCTAVQSASATLIKVHAFGGTGVIY